MGSRPALIQHGALLKACAKDLKTGSLQSRLPKEFALEIFPAA
jgi:hypothetical protein